MAEQKFTPRAENVLRLAQETALELGHGYVGCEHILLGLLREDGSVKLIRRAETTKDYFATFDFLNLPRLNNEE